MFGLKQRLFAAFAVFVLITGQAWAGSEDDLRQYVDENSQKLVQKLNEEKGLYDKDPEAFYTSMDEALDNFVDFRRIAARVMGRYARQASPEQRDEFVEKFKRSLFESYAKALVSAENIEIDVLEAVIMPDNADRASVQSEEHTSELQSRENLVCRLLL